MPSDSSLLANESFVTSRGGVTETWWRPRCVERAAAGPASIPPSAATNSANTLMTRTVFIPTSPSSKWTLSFANRSDSR
jgi:hypothetical protein